MARSIAVRLVVACGLLGGIAAICAAQTYTPPPPPLTTLPPCPADKDAKKRAKRKDCDPTVYPSEAKETKGKNSAEEPPAVAPAAGGTAADKFPFPGEQPPTKMPAAKRFPFPGDEPVAAPPHDSPADGKTTDSPAGRTYSYPGEDPGNVPHDVDAEKKAADGPAGKAFPYPGASNPGASKAPASKDDVPADASRAEPKPTDSPSSSSSSESSSSSSSDSGVAGGAAGKSSAAKNPDDDEDQPQLNDKGSEGRRSKKVIKPQTDTERVDEDLSVARFYGQSGNNMGAYLRAKDAVKTQPEFPEGHFVLGEAAKRLNKKDEAKAEFQTYLKLAPDGQQAKASERALEEMQ